MEPSGGGHWETYEVIDTQVQAHITKCQNLMLTLGRIDQRAATLQKEASDALTSCKAIVVQETDQLSGIYYDKYCTYRDGFFRLAEAVDGSCTESRNEIKDRISKLSSIIESLRPHLYRTETRWVSD